VSDRSRRRAPADRARLAAFQVLQAVRERDAYTNLALPQVLSERRLTGRDAAFVTELVSGTIRGRGLYDAVLAANVTRPLEKLQPSVLDVLRLGTHQVLAMRVPARAAVGTSVDLVRTTVGQGPAGLVNAVLRKVAGLDLAGWVSRVAPDRDEDPLGHFSVAHSHPRWVVEELAAALRVDPRTPAGQADLEAMLAADNEPPRVTLAAVPGLSTVAELEGVGARAGLLSPYAAVLSGGAPADVPAVAEGRARVQDEGSQLVALALARAEVAGDDKRWLDMCAGPGGKSALLAGLAGAGDARLLAAELQEHRARLVQRATRRAGAGLLGVVTADGVRPAWAPSTFDRVLLDAPCSGLGALRRRPEARWRRTPEDLPVLQSLQRSLLDSAVTSVRPGGVVAYVTCSPVLGETSQIVQGMLESRDDVVLEDAVPLFEGVPDLRSDERVLPGTVQLWPHLHRTDAMFFALLRRR
jgi:16S rRNA (cytosine967-C5)-methyltransferase